MAYETGTATSQHDLLDKIRVFTLAQGWTVNKWEDDNSSHFQPDLSTSGKRLHIQKGSNYFNFRSCVRAFPFSTFVFNDTGGIYWGEITGIAMVGSTGYDGGEDWDEQPGNVKSSINDLTAGCCIAEVSGSFTYWFFITDDMIVVTVESASGVYQHLIFGTISQHGSYTGGQFFAGSFDSTYANTHWQSTVPNTDFLQGQAQWITMGMHLTSIDSKTGWWINGTISSDDPDDNEINVKTSVISAADIYGSVVNNTLNNQLMQRSPNSFNGVSTLMQIYVQAERIGGNFSMAGVLPGVRQINMINKLSEDEIILGSDVWKVFPYYIQVGTMTIDNIGLAFLK